MFERDEALRPEEAFRPHQGDVPGDNYEWGSGEEHVEDTEPSPRDRFDMVELHRRLYGHYRRELDAQHDMRHEMALDEALYDHDHWTEEEKSILLARGQVPLVYNVVFTTVNWVLGSQRQKPMDHSILPRRKEGLKQAERKTELLKYLADINHKPMQESRAFAEQVKSGLSWLETGTQDPEDGREIVYDRYESWRNIIFDSASTEFDHSDGRYIFRAKWVDLDRAIAMFPEREEVLRASVETMYDSRTALSVSGDEAMDSQEVAVSTYAGSTAHSEIATRNRVRLVEAWYRTPEPTDFIRGGDFEGEVFDPWSAGHVDQINKGRASVVNRTKERVRVAIMCERGMLIEQPSPYRHNRFPFTPIWGYRRASDGFPYGMIRGNRDIQKDVNKRASKSLWHLSAQRTFVEEGSVKDPEQLREEVTRPDAFIQYKTGHQPPKIQSDLNMAAAHGDAMSRGISMIQQTSGVTDENMGRTTNATSGRAIEARQDQGQLTTNVFFENLRFARRIHGEKLLSNVEQFFTEEKNFRITNKRGNPEYVGINTPPDDDDDNHIGMTKADFVVSEEDYRATHRQAAVNKLVELVGLVGQANPTFAMQMIDLIVEAMDVPKQEEIVKRIRQITGMADPDADPNNPDEETIALMQAKQEQGEYQKAMAMAEKAEKEGKATKAQADAMKAMAEARKGSAELDGLALDNIRTAVETAMQLAGMPNAAVTADRIMTQAMAQTDRVMAEADAVMAQQAGSPPPLPAPPPEEPPQGLPPAGPPADQPSLPPEPVN